MKEASRIVKAGADHNIGVLAIWFDRAERYKIGAGMPFRYAEKRAAEMELLNETQVEK